MLSDSERAALATRLRRGREDSLAPIPPRPPGLTDLPLSFTQEQLWFIDQFAPGQATYNLPFVMSLSGPLDTAALGRALDALAARHETLRTSLVTRADGTPVQVIAPPAPVAVETLPPGMRRAEVRDFMHAEVLRPFTLAEGPLWRTWLARLADDEHMLLFVVHHTMFDGWSTGIVVRELAELYRAQAEGGPVNLPALPVQYADFALWERDRLTGNLLAEHEEYWREAMAGFETLAFPADRPRPVIESFAGALAERTIGQDVLTGLRELSRREGTTAFVTLLAALAALLHRYTGQADVVVGTAVANRTRAELRPMIGFLVATVPIRADLSGDPPFTELVARVHEVTMSAFSHHELPFGKIVQALRVERDPSRGPVFQIGLTYDERDLSPHQGGEVDFADSGLMVGINAAKADLAFVTEARPEGLWIECSYKTALFDEATVRRALAHLEVLLRGVLADPHARISALPVLTRAELDFELLECNDTAATFPDLCIHQAIEAQAERTPCAVAAEFENDSVTYAELDRQASQIASHLRCLGVGPEVLVGVCMGTGLRRLAALLGIWKAGGGYVPLDPELPPGRLSFMISDTGMTVILADEPSQASLPATGAHVLSLDESWPAISRLDGSSPAGVGVAPANVAYVIYTSGSTGQPKGVVVEHRNAVNFLQGMIEAWHIGPGSALLSFAAFTFDVSVADMFMPLLAGGKVVMAPVATLHSPPRLAALIRDSKVTFACLPPAVLSLLAGEDFPGLRTLLSAGEELTSELLRHWLRDGLELYNGYGPTECAIGSTFMKLDPGTRLPPPIGRPKPNYQAYVLDEHLNPVPVGVTGELHIGGAGVARGYLNNPQLTARRFTGDPFRPGGRLYKTGDLARRRPDGTLAFAGRIDHQVKINGLRVELGEIEAALRGHPAVAQAVVTVADGKLAAYLRPVPGSAPAVADLRAHLARTLPGYMIPTYLITLDELPLTTNGKIDKAALPAPETVRPAAERVSPRTLIETALVDIYAAILGNERLGAADSFFDAGGNSLQALRLIAQLHAELAVDLDVSAVFLAPSARQLAAVLRDEHGFDDADLDEESLDDLISQAD